MCLCAPKLNVFIQIKSIISKMNLTILVRLKKKTTKIQMEFRKNKSRNIVRLILSYANFYQVPFFFQFELFLIPFKWLNYIL